MQKIPMIFDSESWSEYNISVFVTTSFTSCIDVINTLQNMFGWYLINLLSTIVSISLESRQEKSKNSFIPSQQISIYKYPYLKSEDLSEPQRKHKDDLLDATRSQSNKEDSSKRYPIQRCTLQPHTLQLDGNHFLREKEDVLERDNIIVMKKRTTRIMQRKPNGYKSTRFINEKRTKYKKGNDMENIDKDRVNHKQEIIIRQSRTRNKNYQMSAIGLYINTSHQVLYNDTHYSPYFDQLLGNYDINYLWSKQKFAKKFDESFKLPPSSLNKQILKLLSRGVTRNRNKNILHTKVNQAPLALAFHGFTTQTDLFFEDGKKKKDKNNNQFVNSNKTPRQNIVLPKLGYELDSNLRLVISNVMSYMGYRNSEETFNKNKEFGRESYLPLGFMDWMGELGEKSKNKIKTIFEEGVVNNVKKIISVKQQIDQFVNKTKEKLKQEIKEIIGQEQPVVIANVSQSNKSKNASVRNNNFDLWHPWLHRVEDDVKVNSFIKEISNRNLRLFTAVGRKTKNNRWKKKLEDLAEMYKDKFNDFIIETSQHNIRSRRGTERVILNSVDVSNSIVKRLVNFVSDEVDRKGSLSIKSEVLKLIDKELKEETKTELKRACSKLNICRSSNGMSTFLRDMATKIVGLEEAKFKQAFKNLAQAVKEENYAEILDVHTDEGIQETMRRYERLSPLFQMAAMSAIRNILTSVNKPFAMYDDIIVSQLDKTMAVFEIVKILDEKVPNSVENINTWNNITSQDITNPDTMTEFVTHMKKVLTELDDETRNDILKQCKIIYP